jgi:hypothetical protein
MAFSYDSSLVAPRDQIRFLVGDTESDEYFLEDEEIVFLMTTWDHKNSVYYTASMAAEAIAAKFAREISVSSDSQSLSTSELQQKYLDLAARLLRQHETLLTGGNVDMGGVLTGEQPDPTVTSPAFGTGMHDFVEAGNQDYGDRGPVWWPPDWGYR